jgi:hypothetical protein
VVRHYGLDLSHENSAALAFFGISPAQVFLADDSLIAAVTVWRPASADTNITGMHLFLCPVDSLLKPLPSTVLLSGPTIVLPLAGPTDAPVRFVLDPPFALPMARAHYAFAIKESDPECASAFPLVADTVREFADGALWQVHPFADCHLLGAHADLIFDIEFCEPGTPAHRASWGEMKVHYR